MKSLLRTVNIISNRPCIMSFEEPRNSLLQHNPRAERLRSITERESIGTFDRKNRVYQANQILGIQKERGTGWGGGWEVKCRIPH